MHSQLGFSVTHLGISTIRGTFDRYQGTLTVGGALDGTSVAISADMSSVNSGNKMRDDHMHAADWFDVANHPEMVFTSTGITANGDAYALTGDLSIKGVTRPVVLDVSYNGSGVFPMDGSTHHGFRATGSISRSAYGVSFGVPGVSDSVELALDLQFVAPKA